MATSRGGGRPPDTRATGQVLAYERKDGLASWYLRVRAYGRRHRVNLGTELDGWTQARARIQLQKVPAKIQAGPWEPPAPQATALDDPTFHQFASSWLARRRPSYVMAQVGHGDSKVTLEIYAQVLERRDREQIGRAFDHLLVGGAAEQATRAPRRGLRGARSSGLRRRRGDASIPAESGHRSRDRAKDRAKTAESR